MVRTALVTVTYGSAADGGDGALVKGVRAVLSGGPFVEVDYVVVPDEQALLRSKLRLLCEGEDVDLVLTMGGVGLNLRDRTPEATESVLDRPLPGLAAHMRAAAAAHDARIVLTRGVAGVRKRTLIVNLPDEPAWARAALAAVVDVLPFALEQIGTGQNPIPTSTVG